MQRVDPRALEYTIIFEIRPTRPRRATPLRRFPIRLKFRAEFFTRPIDESRARSVNSPDIRVYERATLESGLTLEDPRLGAIDRQLDARICRVVGARARTRSYTGMRVWWCHLYISLESRWNSYARRPTCYYISCHRKIRTLAGRPFGVGPERRSWDPRLRYCAIAREVSRYDTYSSPVSLVSNPFVSLLFPRGASARRDVSSFRRLFSELAVFLATNSSSCHRTSIVILNLNGDVQKHTFSCQLLFEIIHCALLHLLSRYVPATQIYYMIYY